MSQLKWPVNAQEPFSSSSTQMHPLGARGEDIFGRVWRYVQAGASELVVGNALQSQAQIANHQDMTPAAAAIGDKTITVTPGATAGAANLYEGGMAVIDTTPGLGYSYPVKSHAAISASTAFVLNLAEGWTVRVALTAANSKVSLYPSPWKNVIQSPANTLTGIVVGVCEYIIEATYYGWVGTGGVFGTLIQGTPDVGELVGCPGSAAGAVNDYAAGAECPVGHMMDTGQDGKVEAVRWFLN
jgi:hypothetical protein